MNNTRRKEKHKKTRQEVYTLIQQKDKELFKCFVFSHKIETKGEKKDPNTWFLFIDFTN